MIQIHQRSNNILVLLLVIINILVIKYAFLTSDSNYKFLLMTMPLLALAVFFSKKRSKGIAPPLQKISLLKKHAAKDDVTVPVHN